MIGALVRHAEHIGLVTEPGFTNKELRWMVQLSGGRVVGVLPLGDGKAGQVFARVPDLSHPNLMALPKALGTAQAAHFLADTCGVVALLPALDKEGLPKTDTKSLTDHAKNEGKHPAFLELLRRAGEQVAELAAVHAVLTDPEQLGILQTELVRQGAKPTEKLSFEVDGQILLRSADWHDWWREFRQQAFTDKPKKKVKLGGGMLDFTSGELVRPAKTHSKLTGLGDVGAIGMGAPLVASDKEAFWSYGLEQGENSSISEENVAAYRAALDAMLKVALPLGQMKVAAWFDHRQLEGEALIQALVDPSSLPEGLQEALDAEPEIDWFTQEWSRAQATSLPSSARQQEAVAAARAQKLLSAIRKGEAPDDLSARYFALAVSGASGRAMVRDWHTGSLESLADAVATWFDDLAITTPSGKNAKRPKFFSLLMNVQRPKIRETKLDDYLKPIRNLQLPLWRAALDPLAPIPMSAMVKVMESHRAEVMNGEFNKALGKEGTPIARSRVYVRMGLLIAYHQRQLRFKKEPLMKLNLNPEHPNPAYHCGRLMYLLAELQKKSAGEREINAGIIQRYYGSASATPNLVLGRLIALSQHHLNKLNAKYAYWWQGQLGQTMNAISDELPKTLTPVEQSLFALGYYHQLVFSRTPKSGNPEPDTDISADAVEQTDTDSDGE